MPTPFQRFERTLTRHNLWLYILKLLEENDLYPYEVRKKIEDRFGFRPGNVTKLRLGGYVEVSKTKKLRGPKRVYFRITEKGKKELENALNFYEKQLTILK